MAGALHPGPDHFLGCSLAHGHVFSDGTPVIVHLIDAVCSASAIGAVVFQIATHCIHVIGMALSCLMQEIVAAERVQASIASFLICQSYDFSANIVQGSQFVKAQAESSCLFSLHRYLGEKFLVAKEIGIDNGCARDVFVE